MTVNYSIPSFNATQTSLDEILSEISAPLPPHVEYNGGFSPDDDPADYMRAIKGVRL